MDYKDTYKTIDKAPNQVLYKDKNSKFFGYAYPILNEEDVKFYLNQLKKEHHAARHWCYAYQIGTETISYRANDDGEPSNTAGAPIYGQIQSFDVTNVLIVIVRYFGGVKLGVGGLINAYRSTAKMTLEEAQIVKKTINKQFLITFDYKHMNKVMRIIKENNLKIINQKLELNCQIIISVRKKKATAIYHSFDSIFDIQIEKQPA